MTWKDGLTARALPWNFGGVLMRGDEVVWSCHHQHPTRDDAQRCAFEEIKRRRTAEKS